MMRRLMTVRWWDKGWNEWMVFIIRIVLGRRTVGTVDTSSRYRCLDGWFGLGWVVKWVWSESESENVNTLKTEQSVMRQLWSLFLGVGRACRCFDDGVSRYIYNVSYILLRFSVNTWSPGLGIGYCLEVLLSIVSNISVHWDFSFKYARVLDCQG